MRKAWIKSATWIIAAIGAWGIGTAVNAVFNQTEVNWLVSIYRQKKALSEQIQAPRRILLVGGSATHFGVNAAQIEQNLKMPVVNLGLHAGLGLDAICAIAKEQVRPGDLVVLLPEYRILANPDGDHNKVMTQLFGIQIGDYQIGESDPKQQVNKALLIGSLGINSTIQLLQPRSTGQSGYSTELSARGDALKLPTGKVRIDQVDEKVSAYSFQQLKAFRQQVEAKGGRLVFGLPWRFAQADSNSKAIAQAVVDTLAQIAPVIYDRRSLNLKTDPQLFGDTPYHLSNQGRLLRSREMTQQLKPLL
ncbi:hypothetical protein IQ250_02530 [Pseudanabaenaceae cyanobacterium LEGE 13415]|nr:hypothetical protein [Pseudanabaenaceae cyanobacterium LEGE 13415]